MEKAKQVRALDGDVVCHKLDVTNGLKVASLARELGARQVIIPPMPGLFSAVGLLIGGIERHDVRLGAFAPDVVRSLRETHQNPVFLPGVTIQRTKVATGDQREALEGAPIHHNATPTHQQRMVARAVVETAGDDVDLRGAGMMHVEL